jgi:hypothetical protein
MTLRGRLRRLEDKHRDGGGDLPPIVLTLPLLGPDDPLGPPGEYRSIMPNGREYVLRAVDVFADGGVDRGPE